MGQRNWPSWRFKKKERLPDGFDPSARPCDVALQVVPSAARQELLSDKDKPIRASGRLTLSQANLLTAMLGGFWGRKSDGHPGPDLLGRGLMILGALVKWERSKKESDLRKISGKDPPGSAGRRS